MINIHFFLTVFGYADVAICDLWVQYYRNHRIEFSYPVFQTCATVIVPRPHLVQPNWTRIFAGLSFTTWMAILCCFMICWIFLSCIKNCPSQTKYLSVTIDKIFIDLISILLTANSISSSKNAGYIQVLTAWSILSSFIVLFYSCDVISFLTVPNYTKRIDSVKDCVASNLSWGSTVEIDMSIYLNLKKLSHKIFANRFDVSVNNSHEIEELIRREQYALLVVYFFDGTAAVDSGVLESIEFDASQFRLMRSCFYSPYISFGFPLNSPYREAMEYYLIHMFEAGLYLYHKRFEIQKHHAKNWPSIFLEEQSSAEVQVLRMEHVYGAFIVLALGCALALLVFLWEMRGLWWMVCGFLYRE